MKFPKGKELVTLVVICAVVSAIVVYASNNVYEVKKYIG